MLEVQDCLVCSLEISFLCTPAIWMYKLPINSVFRNISYRVLTIFLKIAITMPSSSLVMVHVAELLQQFWTMFSKAESHLLATYTLEQGQARVNESQGVCCDMHTCDERCPSTNLCLYVHMEAVQSFCLYLLQAQVVVYSKAVSGLCQTVTPFIFNRNLIPSFNRYPLHARSWMM